MTTETNRIFDVLLANPEASGRLSKVATAFPTAKGAGYRFTLKTALPEGAQIVLLPGRSRPAQAEPQVIKDVPA